MCVRVGVSHRVFKDVSVLGELQQNVGGWGWRKTNKHAHIVYACSSSNISQHNSVIGRFNSINTQTQWPRSGLVDLLMTETLPDCRRGPPELETDTAAAHLETEVYRQSGSWHQCGAPVVAWNYSEEDVAQPTVVCRSIVLLWLEPESTYDACATWHISFFSKWANRLFTACLILLNFMYTFFERMKCMSCRRHNTIKTNKMVSYHYDILGGLTDSWCQPMH